MLARINRLKNWQVALIIAILGLAVLFTGLATPFQGDDITQIVNNVPVHSIRNIHLIFEGGTYYNGQGLKPLIGTSYRPLMMTTFSVIYTLFGPHAIAFHIFQLLLFIGSAIILYLFFKFSFKPALAFLLSLIFLVHPLNSQVAFAIPSMSDALFFFFGILAIYLLVRFRSVRSLILVSLCLFLSMLSKETAIVFIAIALLYLFWFDRKRIFAFLGIMLVPIGLYLALRINAVGLNQHLNIAPIDNLRLGERLLNIPLIILFYLSKIVFPWRLATSYYWVHQTLSFRYFVMPLLIDLIVAGLIIYVGWLIRHRVSKAQYFTYLFFAIWVVVGLLPYLQIIPLDMTACETWFYVSFVGVMGMTGVALAAFRINAKWLLIIGLIVIGILGVRTALRGLDYRTPYNLAVKNVSASPDDYGAYDVIAIDLFNQGLYAKAQIYEQRSISIWPSYTNYVTLGTIFMEQHKYAAASNAYYQSLKYGQSVVAIEGIAALTLMYGNTVIDREFLLSELNQYPQNYDLWLYLAIFEEKNDDNKDAKIAVINAEKYGQVLPLLYNNILNNLPFTLNISDLNINIYLP